MNGDCHSIAVVTYTHWRAPYYYYYYYYYYS